MKGDLVTKAIMGLKKGYRRAVFIVVYRFNKGVNKTGKAERNTEYLVLKRKLHWIGWEFPKGASEKGETLRQAAIRETREETGLRPLKLRKFKVSGKYRYTRDFPDRKSFNGQTYVLFAAQVKAGKHKKVKLDKKEHSAFKWVVFKQALRTLKWKNQKKCLRIVNKTI